MGTGSCVARRTRRLSPTACGGVPQVTDVRYAPRPLTAQSSLPGLCPVEAALSQLSQAGAETRGAVFTRREVVEFILDMVGYTVDRPLFEKSLLDPSFGTGDFLFVVIERLLEAWRRQDDRCSAIDLADCIRAVELHRSTFETTREAVVHRLIEAGIDQATANALAGEWLVHGDFLLSELPPEFSFVVGNPPYVRQELVPDPLVTEYRARYTTVYDRADLYIPFIERSVGQLSADGKVGIICADRWTKNRYGGPLRKLLSEQFHLDVFVDMVDTPAFQSEVIAYPAIFVIGREKTGPTRVARRPEISRKTLESLARQLVNQKKRPSIGPITEVHDFADGAKPWILEASDQIRLVRRLEHTFPSLEEAGCKVGIGVATGADQAFIGRFDDLDVEDDRKLPLATTRDILSGEVQWRGLGVVNPFADEGGLVDLASYPRLKRYLELRREEIAKRHVARKAPANWFRTIDRIYPALVETPKLLIPDIKGEAHVVYEEGRLYPHHNLYFITSMDWDLRALRAVLLSGIAKLFVAAYSTRMRGGYLRFQAQYLRRIRLPLWSAIPHEMAAALVEASQSGDTSACNHVVFDMYNLTDRERNVVYNDNSECHLIGE
ncbi:MAG: N-6 DNA methylase [Proteobacteria bacterium]|nr:N-6 DNA methylase [Pseudomonadota bacterium]